MPDRFEDTVKDFASLSDCIEFTQREFGGGPNLFRGERTDRFLTSPPMLERVRTDRSLPPGCRKAIEERVQRLHKDLQEFLDLDPNLAMGFLRHYEAPTDLLDLTSEPPVAAFFAAGGDVGTDGLLAVVPQSKRTEGAITDLRNHPKALRPRLQSAFTLNCAQYGDLKSKSCVSELGVQWYRFTLTNADKERYGSRRALLDAHTDPVAGVIQLLLDSYGKTNDWTADWLARHVVAAPFVTRIAGKDPSGMLLVQLVSLSEAEMEFDDAAERFNNGRIWSNRYNDTRGSGGLESWRMRPL